MVENKYTELYIEKYGIDSCMSIWDLKAPYKSVEEVYKESLEKGVTWQKLLHFTGYKKDILL